MRTKWRKQAIKNFKKFTYLTALVNTHDITCADIEMKALEVNLNKLKNMISTKIENIEEADEKRGLYYDRHKPPYTNHKETLPTRIMNI